MKVSKLACGCLQTGLSTVVKVISDSIDQNDTGSGGTRWHDIGIQLRLQLAGKIYVEIAMHLRS
jgi:hypothetical protein